MATLNQVPATSSISSRFQNTCCSDQAKQNGKIVVWLSGSFASFFLPIPGFLKVGISGALLFNGLYEIARHPDSSAMRRESTRILMQSRNWKHLAAGALTSGGFWALGGLALTHGVMVVVPILLIGGLPVAALVTNSNAFCTPNQVPQPFLPLQDLPA